MSNGQVGYDQGRYENAADSPSNLMARDEFKNLGFAEEEPPKETPKGQEGGTKGELQW